MDMEGRIVLAIVLFSSLISTVLATSHYFDYIVVGAGPAGLQLGYFFQRANRNYVVLERANVSGSFFTVYPRHDRLISINKRHTGKTNKEFNLRHDWNSLLSDDETLNFGRYSKELFPHRSTYVKYLNDFQTKLGLNIWHNVDVRNISHFMDDTNIDYKYTMKDQLANTYTCKTLIVATGMWVPQIPSFPGAEYTEGYETVSVNPDDFEGQTVLILGRGNAAFEVADRIYGATNLIHMIGRSRVRLSWSTHYVGDLRGVNNALLDTYMLKSLDAVLETNIDHMKLTWHGAKYFIDVSTRNNSKPMHLSLDNFAMRDSYDRVIRCLGFKFNVSIFDSSLEVRDGVGRKSKWPKIDHDYQLVDHQDLYLAGTITHSLDFRKAAGGFIHGFRYTARALHRLLDWKNHGVPWPSTSLPHNDLLNTIIKRINEGSGIYQMFGMLGDVAVLGENSFQYFEEFPVNLLHEFPKYTGCAAEKVVVVTLQYGTDFSGAGKDTFRFNRATGEPSNAHNSNFLHPVIYYYKTLPSESSMKDRHRKETLPRPDLIHHIVEDFLTNFTAPTSHILPLRRFIETVLNQDMRHFYTEECLELALTHQTLPHACQMLFQNGAGIEAVENGFEFLPIFMSTET